MILFDELVIICIYSKFAAAEQDDLWHYLTEQAHRDKTLPEDLTVKIIMDTWTLQMGFPGMCLKYFFDLLKFIYSEKATKFCKIFTLLLSYVVPV